MRKLIGSTLGLTAIFLGLLNSSQSLAIPSGRWVRIITLSLYPNGTKGTYYVERNSIKKINNFRYYWAGLVYNKPFKVKNQGKTFSIGQIFAYTSIDCTNKSDYQMHRIEVFDPNNKKITSLDFNRENGYLPAQGTTLTGNYVCSRK
ncbi:MAG TPA: surface-adhesin E family protein [Waterburya sp.]|jgi:hypothetical protein